MHFRVKAVRGEAQIVIMSMEAADAHDAERRTREQGYEVLAVKRTALPLRNVRTNREVFPVLLFAQELVALLEAGLNLVAALEALGENEKSISIRMVIERILTRLRNGEEFSTALMEFPNIFSPLFIATVRSNERTGGLIEALRRYALYHKQMDEVRSKLIGALIYPALLFVVGSGVALFLLFYVVPKFRRIFEDMGGDLPFFSRMLVDWGRAVDSYGSLLAIAIFAVVGAILAIGLQKGLKESAMRRAFHFPGIGERLRLYQFARLYRTVGMLTRSGLPITEAMAISSEMLAQTLRLDIAGAEKQIREGGSFSDSMASHQLTTPIAFRLLRVGEEGGNMAEMLERIASLFEEQISRWVERFTRLFEPVLMAAIGVVIGVIVVFLYMPIFELAGSVQ